MLNPRVFQVLAKSAYACCKLGDSQTPKESFIQKLKSEIPKLPEEIGIDLTNCEVIDACHNGAYVVNHQKKIAFAACRGTSNFWDVLIDDLPVGLANIGMQNIAEHIGLYSSSRKLFMFFYNCHSKYKEYTLFSCGHSLGAFPAILLHLYGPAVQSMVFNPLYIPDLNHNLVHHRPSEAFSAIRPKEQRIITVYKTQKDLISRGYVYKSGMGVEIIVVTPTEPQATHFSCRVKHCIDLFRTELPFPARGYIKPSNTQQGTSHTAEHDRRGEWAAPIVRYLRGSGFASQRVAMSPYITMFPSTDVSSGMPIYPFIAEPPGVPIYRFMPESPVGALRRSY